MVPPWRIARRFDIRATDWLKSSVKLSASATLRRGDLLAVMSAGAYGAVQSGTYNTRLLVPEVLVHGAQWHVVRPRETYDDLIGRDSLPGWLGT